MELVRKLRPSCLLLKPCFLPSGNVVFLEKLLEATQRPPLLWAFREGAGTGGEGDTSHQAGPDEWTVGDIRSSGSERESPVGGLTKPGSSRLPDICVSLWVHSPDGRPQGGGQDGVDLITFGRLLFYLTAHLPAQMGKLRPGTSQGHKELVEAGLESRKRKEKEKEMD